jgi:hypothetical protein
LDIFSSAGLWSSFVFSGFFIAEGVGVGDKGLGDAKMIDVHTLLEVFFEHVPEIKLFH